MSTVVKDLGAVSAYAYAVEKGYTGTEAEFAELMADYAEVGQRAEDAADSALESKTAAQTAATTATNKASEATTAAQTATTKAGEASTSASTATSAKDTAVSASQTATSKATEAAQSATSANTAKVDAVTAKTAAETAQTAAETAQEAAEDAAESVSASAAQIATNTADISDIKENLSDIDDRVAELEAGGAGGLSMAAVNLLNTILSEAVYGTDQTANIELLYKALSDIKPVSITAVLTSRALVGLAYSALEFEITATLDDESTITTDEGYRVLTSGNVVSGSNTVTVSFRGVTTTVTFTAEQVTTYTVTYNLTDVTSSNITALVVEDDYYSTTLSVGDDYAFDGCTVTMGGVDITATAYSNMGILITAVTGNVVITASATEITYMDTLIRTRTDYSNVILYSDNLSTQIKTIYYYGTSFVSEYPALSDCSLHWVITNNTDSAVSLNGVGIGSLPCNTVTYPTQSQNLTLQVPYAILCDNQSGTLDAGASIEGDYFLRAGHQLAFIAQVSTSQGTGSADKLTIAISGNFVPNEFDGFSTYTLNSNTPNYGGYRVVNFYRDNGETLIGNPNGYKSKITDELTAGTYDVYFRLVANYDAAKNAYDKLIGAVATDTDTTSNYACGFAYTLSYNEWFYGQMTITSDNMTVICSLVNQYFTNGAYMDIRVKEVTA